VIVQEERVNAHATVVAVTKVFPTTDATETTVRAVVRRFLVGHPEIANVAVVFTKLDAALDAVVAVVECKNRFCGFFFKKSTEMVRS
jgi:hypothetical protein